MFFLTPKLKKEKSDGGMKSLVLTGIIIYRSLHLQHRIPVRLFIGKTTACRVWRGIIVPRHQHRVGGSLQDQDSGER